MPKKVSFKSIDCACFLYNSSEKDAFEKNYETKVIHELGQSNGNGAIITEESCENEVLMMKCISHECSHLVDWILHNRLNVELTDTSFTEIRAYYLDYLVGEYIKYIKKEK